MALHHQVLSSGLCKRAHLPCYSDDNFVTAGKIHVHALDAASGDTSSRQDQRADAEGCGRTKGKNSE